MQDLYIGDIGKGFPLVLVHGFLGSSDMWQPQINFFKKDFRVITPDLPGFGKSNKLKSLSSIQSIAKLLLENLQKKRINKFHLLGHSMGGMIAQVLAANFPNRIKTLTSVMSTTFAPHLPPPSSAAEDNLRDLAGGEAEASREELMRQRGFHPESMERHLMAIFKTGDRTQEVQTITAPTLVLHGSEDTLIPPAHGVHIAEQIAGAKFVLIDGMGHNLPESYHDQVVALMTDHIVAYDQ